MKINSERVGFEPTVPVKGHLVSSEALSATQPPLHGKCIYNVTKKTNFVHPLSLCKHKSPNRLGACPDERGCAALKSRSGCHNVVYQQNFLS